MANVTKMIRNALCCSWQEVLNQCFNCWMNKIHCINNLNETLWFLGLFLLCSVVLKGQVMTVFVKLFHPLLVFMITPDIREQPSNHLTFVY